MCDGDKKITEKCTNLLSLDLRSGLDSRGLNLGLLNDGGGDSLGRGRHYSRRDALEGTRSVMMLTRATNEK